MIGHGHGDDPLTACPHQVPGARARRLSSPQAFTVQSATSRVRPCYEALPHHGRRQHGASRCPSCARLSSVVQPRSMGR